MKDARPYSIVRVTLGRSVAMVTDRIGATLRMILVVQGLVVAIGVPFLGWLFPTLLDLVGERSVTTINAVDVFGNPLAFAVILLVLVITGLLVFADLLVFLIAARRERDGLPGGIRGALGDLLPTLASLRHPSTLLLVPYFMLLVPLSGFALGGVFTGGIRVPAPLDIGVLEGVPGTIGYFVVVLGVLYVGARLIMTLPILAAGGSRTDHALRASWRLTQGRVTTVAAIVGIVVGAALLVAAGLASIGLVPTRYADADLPDWAPLIAAISLAIIELGVFFVVGLAVAVLARSAMIVLQEADGASRAEAAGDSAPVRRSTAVWRGVGRVGIALAVCGALTASNASTISGLASGESTVLVSHRGVLSNAVENTLPALEAAAAARPDFVEIDVQETRDGDFVVFHDATLQRLAGDPRAIGELTVAELRRVVLEQNGVKARISTLDDFIVRAERLEQPLLIELKPRGDETPDYLENFAQVLRDHDVVDEYMVASFNKLVIEEFAEIEPAIPTGYIVRYNLGRAPSTTADFLVINASAYSPALRDDAWDQGLALYVWTVDDMRTVRDLLRDSVDGIITNRTNAAQAERQQIRFETGVATRLEDLVRRTFGF